MTTATIAVGESLNTELADAFNCFLAQAPSDGTALLMTSPENPNSSTCYDLGDYLPSREHGGGDTVELQWQVIGIDVGAGTATFATRTARFRAAEAAADFIRNKIPAGSTMSGVFRSLGGIVISSDGLEEEYDSAHPTLIGKIIDHGNMLWIRRGIDDDLLLSYLLAYRVSAYEDWDYWPGVVDVDITDFLEASGSVSGILHPVASMLRAATGAPIDGLAQRAWEALGAADAERQAIRDHA